MSEVEILIHKKIQYYKEQYNDANINGLKAHKDHYHKCHTKLKKMLEILIND